MNSYKNYHFKEEVSKQHGISFDFKLLDGPSTTKNAVALLRHAGYPNEIANGADLRIKKTVDDE